jgi:hypothetical protein
MLWDGDFTVGAFAAWVSLQVVVGGGCASKAPSPTVSASALRQPEVVELLRRQGAPRIVRSPTGAAFRFSRRGAGDRVLQVAGIAASVPDIGFIVGAPLAMAVALGGAPFMIAESRSEDATQQFVAARVPDPIAVVERKFAAMMRPDPSLKASRAATPCSGRDCAREKDVGIELRTVRWQVCAPQYAVYVAELVVTRAAPPAPPVPLWRTECLAIKSEPAIAGTDDAIAKDVRSAFDALAAKCADQLVTALLGLHGDAVTDSPTFQQMEGFLVDEKVGRGDALPQAPPPAFSQLPPPAFPQTAPPECPG